MITVKPYESPSESVIEFLEQRAYDIGVIEFNEPVIAMEGDRVVGVGNYSEQTVEVVVDELDVAIEICKFFGDRPIVSVDCPDEEVSRRINWIVKHPFVSSAEVIRILSTMPQA